MDIRSVKGYRDELHFQILQLKYDAFVKFKVPSILVLVEMEIQRLNEELERMKPEEVHVHTDKDALMLIKSVTNVFSLRGSASVEVLKNRLIYELKVIKLCFRPPPHGLSNFVSIVIAYLERHFEIELYAEKARGFSMLLSSDTTEEQSSDERVPCKNLKIWIDFAIGIIMDANPEKFHGIHVIEALRRLSRMVVINVDDEDVQRLVIQKCNEAIESRNEKLARSWGSKSNTNTRR